MLRILDANLNRVGEGLRVLEDIARFLLNDSEISQRLKSLRHELLPGDWLLQRQLLDARNSEHDVGAFAEVAEEGKRLDAVGIVTANAKRVEESLRVLEEVAKLQPQVSALDWDRFKRARFTVYELERRLAEKGIPDYISLAKRIGATRVQLNTASRPLSADQMLVLRCFFPGRVDIISENERDGMRVSAFAQARDVDS